MSTERQKCGNCAFFERGTSHCLRFPPVPVAGENDIYTRFPEVTHHWWCGEYCSDDEDGE